jgi:hypothetical protein
MAKCLQISTASQLQFLKMTGPPQLLFEPEDYARKWIAKGKRDAIIF